MCKIQLIEQDLETCRKIRTFINENFSSVCSILHTTNYKSGLVANKKYSPDIVIISSRINDITCIDYIDYLYEFNNTIVLLLIEESDVNHLRYILRKRNERFLFKPLEKTNFLKIMNDCIINVVNEKCSKTIISELNKKVNQFEILFEQNIIQHIVENYPVDVINNDFKLINQHFLEGFFILGKLNDTVTRYIEFIKETYNKENIKFINATYHSYNILFVFTNKSFTSETYRKMTSIVKPLDSEQLLYSNLINTESQLHMTLSKLLVECDQFHNRQNNDEYTDADNYLVHYNSLHHYAQRILQYSIMGNHDCIYSYLKRLAFIFNTFERNDSIKLFTTFTKEMQSTFEYALKLKIENVEISPNDYSPYYENTIFSDYYKSILQSMGKCKHKSSFEQLKKILLYIKNNFTNPNLRLDDVAEHLQISSFYICKLLKKYTDFTFTDFLNDCRIDYAKSHLKTDKKVKEIAGISGFNSTTYFIRIFKKRMGIQPLDYRNSLQLNSFLI